MKAVLDPSLLLPDDPNYGVVGYGLLAGIKVGFRLECINSDCTDFKNRETILDERVFGRDDPVTMVYITYRKDHACEGTVAFTKSFAGKWSGTLEVAKGGYYEFELLSSAGEVNFIMGHDKCDEDSEFGMAAC